ENRRRRSSPQAAELPQPCRQRLKPDDVIGVDAHSTRALDVLRTVVEEDDLGRGDSEGAEGRLIDRALGLAEAEVAGREGALEVAIEGEVAVHELPVRLARVAQGGDAIALSQVGEEVGGAGEEAASPAAEVLQEGRRRDVQRPVAAEALRELLRQQLAALE